MRQTTFSDLHRVNENTLARHTAAFAPEARLLLAVITADDFNSAALEFSLARRLDSTQFKTSEEIRCTYDRPIIADGLHHNRSTASRRGPLDWAAAAECWVTVHPSISIEVTIGRAFQAFPTSEATEFSSHPGLESPVVPDST
jgi:hypothetical protein